MRPSCSSKIHLSIRLQGNIALDGRLPCVPAWLIALFSELVQSVRHWLAGNSDQPAERLVQLQDQENSNPVRTCGGLGACAYRGSAMNCAVPPSQRDVPTSWFSLIIVSPE